jgi:hypothetical protein
MAMIAAPNACGRVARPTEFTSASKVSDLMKTGAALSSAASTSERLSSLPIALAAISASLRTLSANTHRPYQIISIGIIGMG